MTLTAKKRKFDAKEDAGDITKTVEEFGQKYHCDSCAKSVNLRIKCAVCPDFDLCVECFSQGVEVKNHLKDHAYRVMESLNFPIFQENWGADEELLFVEGLETFGIGNWDQISEHIGTKNKLECEEHYSFIYTSSSSYPFPEKTVDPFLNGSKRVARPPNYEVIKLPKCPRPPASQPANHEIQGFMPGRGDFEFEFENEAEQAVKDMEFTPEDTPQDVQLKCTILDIYNTFLGRRNEKKAFVLSRKLTDFKKIQSIEKKRPKEEKELCSRLRPFARLSTEEEFDTLLAGCISEMKLRQTIAVLQEYYSMGITTMVGANEYEKEKMARLHAKQTFQPAPIRRKPDEVDVKQRKVADPLDIQNTDGSELLSTPEAQLCSSLRLFPRAYLAIKDTILKEYALKGSLKRRQARALVKIDVNKTAKIFDFFVEMGWIK